MDIDEFNKKLNVTFRWEEEKNEFNEPLLSCEGNFPHVDDKRKIKISAPLKDWDAFLVLEAGCLEKILWERFIDPALEIVESLKKESYS